VAIVLADAWGVRDNAVDGHLLRTQDEGKVSKVGECAGVFPSDESGEVEEL
jgi:hypothetical protein